MELHLLSRFVLLREVHHLCGAGCDGRGGAGLVPLPLMVRVPRLMLGGAGLAAAGTGARPLRLTVARPPAATTAGSPGPWVEWNEDTKVNVFNIIYWSASETVEFMKQTPPPALGVHDVAQLMKTFEDLMQSADSESLEVCSATQILLLNHWYLWETYALEPVKGYRGPKMFLYDCVKFACGADGYVLHEYLNTFGLSFGSMPKKNMDRDLIAAILYVSKRTREYVGEYRERLRVLKMRRNWEADEKEKKEATEEEAARLKEEQEISGDFPDLGAGGV